MAVVWNRTHNISKVCQEQGSSVPRAIKEGFPEKVTRDPGCQME